MDSESHTGRPARNALADPALPNAAPTGLPARVRRLRRHLNLTQEDFAARVGVSVITVHRWETGQSRPRRLALASLREIETEVARQAARRKPSDTPTTWAGCQENRMDHPPLDLRLGQKVCKRR